MLKGAIAGFGAVVENGHVPAFAAHADSFQIAAVADADPRRREAASRLYPAANLYASLEELLAGEKRLDFVDIATPPFLHEKQAAMVLGKGISVLCEKPLVLSSRSYEKLARLARKKGKTLFSVHNWKAAPPLAKAFELIADGKIGSVQHAELHVLRSQPAIAAGGNNWRQDPRSAGGGIMVDHGWHNFYLAYCFAGRAPVSVSAVNQHPDIDSEALAEDVSSVQIDFGGSDAFIYLTWRSPVRKNLALVYGDRGLITVRDSAVVLETRDAPPQVFETGEKLSGGSAHPQWMAGTLKDFLGAMAGGPERAQNAEEARACVLLTEAGYKSAKTGKRVPLGKKTPATAAA